MLHIPRGSTGETLRVLSGDAATLLAILSSASEVTSLTFPFLICKWETIMRGNRMIYVKFSYSENNVSLKNKS